MIKGGKSKHLLAFYPTFYLNFSNCFEKTQENSTTPLMGKKRVLSNHTAHHRNWSDREQQLFDRTPQKENYCMQLEWMRKVNDIIGNNDLRIWQKQGPWSAHTIKINKGTACQEFCFVLNLKDDS